MKVYVQSVRLDGISIGYKKSHGSTAVNVPLHSYPRLSKIGESRLLPYCQHLHLSHRGEGSEGESESNQATHDSFLGALGRHGRPKSSWLTEQFLLFLTCGLPRVS